MASGGRDFTFYHSYPGLSMGSEETDANFASVICNNFQWATLLAAEQVLLPRTTSWLASAAHSRCACRTMQASNVKMKAPAALERFWLLSCMQ